MGIDVGEVRIGLARINAIARLPEPLMTVTNDEKALEQISDAVREHGSDVLVVGLPRGLDGQETQQTLFSREFADTMKSLGVPITMQDEALTSRRAEELIAQGVYKRNSLGQPVTIDEVAACLILEDFIQEKKGSNK